jgi:acyl dehydratase
MGSHGGQYGSAPRSRAGHGLTSFGRVTDDTWPQPLLDVNGPFSAARIDGAAEGMGAYGDATRDLVNAGLVQPDLITGMTLFILARQPRRARVGAPKKASAIAGGVWVREQFTIHRPIKRTDPFVITGVSTGRYVKKGRRYCTNTCESHTSEGSLFASNLTTGLLGYKVQDGLADNVEGLPLEDTPAPLPDWNSAANNPHLAQLRTATVGQTLGGEEVLVSLAMMAARDTANPDNPIHSDLDEAKKAGLERPIAGGSHVLSFPVEAIMAEFGPESLLHGAHLDARWKAPTHADVRIVPTATIIEADPDRVVFDLRVDLVDGPTAMVGTITVPLPR